MNYKTAFKIAAALSATVALTFTYLAYNTPFQADAAGEDVRPNATASETGGSCTTTNAHTTMDDDVEGGGDASICTADSATSNHDIRLNFATPSGNPVTTTDAQTFKLLARNSQTSGSGAPTVALDLYCNGSLVEAGADQAIGDSYTTIIETFTFNSGSCTSDGSTVEVLVDCTAANNGGTNNDSSCDYEAVEWVAEYTQNPPTVALNTADATAFGADTTPTLDFTGTDVESDDVRYNLYLATAEANASTTITLDGIGGGSGTSAEAQQAVGQRVNLSEARTVDIIELKLRKQNNPTDDVMVSVYSGSETGTLIGTSSVINGSNITSSANGSLYQFEFDPALSLSAATDYYVTITRSGARDTTNKYLTFISIGDLYPSGITRLKSNNVWSDNTAFSSGSDLHFLLSSTSLDVVSGTDTGFSGSPDNTDPFTSGQQVSFTVQAGDELTTGTYYWRVRGIDPSGSNTYGAWATTRSFTVDTGGGGGSTSTVQFQSEFFF